MILHHLSETWQVGISLLSDCQKTLEGARGPQPSRKKTSPTACTSGSVLIFVSGNPIFQSKNRFLAVSAPESVDIISDAQIALFYICTFLDCLVHVIHCHRRIPPLLFISLLANGVKTGVNFKSSTSFESGSASAVLRLVPINEMLFPNSPICLRSTSSSMWV